VTTSLKTPWPCWTRSTSSDSAPPRSARPAAASSRTPSGIAAGRATHCFRGPGHPPCRGGEPHRDATGPAGRGDRDRRSTRRGVRLMTVRPAAVLRLPPERPGRGAADRPRRSPTHSTPARSPETTHLGLSRHRWGDAFLAYFTTSRARRRHRGRQWDHRAPPTPRERAPQPAQPPAAHAPRRRRPCLMTPTRRCPKSRFPGAWE
jgi:hypothetical protein